MKALPLAVHVPTVTEPVGIEGAGVSMSVSLVPPECHPAAAPVALWDHRDRVTRPMVLAGRAGQVTEDTYSAGVLSLIRQTWVEEAGQSLAIRVRLVNQGAPLELDALLPLCLVGDQGLMLGDVGAGGWEVIAQARYKNGVPTALRPGAFDEDYAQAISRTGEQGDAAPGVDGHSVAFEMDSFGLFRPRDKREGPCLLIGYLSQTGHLARLVLRTDAERVGLESLRAECEFDGCRVPRGGERTSQWVFMRVGSDPQALASDFADRVGVYHHVAPPADRAPSVMCSWYYYGPHFTESDFGEDMDYLASDRIPFDVFLIDECWDMHWGDWQGNDRWPSGMKAAADRIRSLGYRPGIWTCPYLVKVNSKMAVTHRDWLLRLRDGSLHVFQMDGPNYVLDPTFPGVCDHIEALFRRLTQDWGYTYHKLDFLRSVFMDKTARFYDPHVTRLEAYRRGLEAVRRGIGPDAYLSVCGGHYGGSLGLADSQRSGSDVTAMWSDPPALPKIKQNIHRTWMSRLWHVDPDAMMVRRRSEPINDTRHGRLSLGLWTDDEARTITVNQYIGGGMVCFTEKWAEMDADRKALYRHVIPSVNAPSVPLDYFAPRCPSQMRTLVTPTCSDLGPWVTVAVVNWEDDAQDMSFDLVDKVLEGLSGEKFLVYEFFDQRLLGVYEAGDRIPLGPSAPHGSKVVKILPWDGHEPRLVATDLHFSMGGVEIAECAISQGRVAGRLDTRWQYPVVVTAAFPDAGGDPVLGRVRVPAGRRCFEIGAPGSH